MKGPPLKVKKKTIGKLAKSRKLQAPGSSDIKSVGKSNI